MQLESAPDPAWVGALTGCSSDRAERLLTEAAAERHLFAHLAREHRREGRSSYIEIDAPLELHAIVRALRPLRVLEVGVSSGVSTAYLLAALDRNGRGTLHSVDLPSYPRRSRSGRAAPLASWTLPPGREPGWAIPSALRHRWVLHLGDKGELLPQLAKELPRIDLFVYDVPHECSQSYREFRSLDPRLPVGAVAIADHGPGGSLCPALARWAARTGGRPVRRVGLGLFGFRKRRRARSTPRTARPGPLAKSTTGPRATDGPTPPRR
ncbi:MAG TPA: class I SAM-dependent methyltransferase [Thermoplasmata archaeon]|nr:class I SAM-dependent methyltransferase [Thermoplasmata archaeon]